MPTPRGLIDPVPRFDYRDPIFHTPRSRLTCNSLALRPTLCWFDSLAPFPPYDSLRFTSHFSHFIVSVLYLRRQLYSRFHPRYLWERVLPSDELKLLFRNLGDENSRWVEESRSFDRSLWGPDGDWFAKIPRSAVYCGQGTLATRSRWISSDSINYGSVSRFLWLFRVYFGRTAVLFYPLLCFFSSDLRHGDLLLNNQFFRHTIPFFADTGALW